MAMNLAVIVDAIELELVLCREHGVLVFLGQKQPNHFNDQAV